jgi:peptide deformylase
MSSSLKLHAEGEAPLEIVTIGDPFLRRTSPRVGKKRLRACRSLSESMLDALRYLKGQGLAARQVGSELRMAIVETRPNELSPDVEPTDLVVLVNPVIVARSTEMSERWEACFSVPGYLGLVARHSTITVEYEDLDGRLHTQQFSGYLARVVQHEVDHLDGAVYLDRIAWEKGAVNVFTTRDNYKRCIRSPT